MLTFAQKVALRRKLGAAGENAVCELLQSYGKTILARNWKCKAGELDIVAIDNDGIIFVEVKSMRMKPNFTPAANLSPRQRRRNYHAAQVYLRAMDIRNIPARFDLAEVVFRGDLASAITLHPDYLPPLPPQEV